MAGIYIHIPFCRKACHYCNFHFSTTHHLMEEMVGAIVLEIHQRRSYVSEAINTIYFGGGTPSIVDVSLLGKIMDAVHSRFVVHRDAEVTLEANPDDIHTTILQQWKTMGINRLSIGVQSFRGNDLLWMNRAHSAPQAISCIKAAQDAGFSNLNIDLIYGIPHLTNAMWLQNLEQAFSLNIPHFSCYALTVEKRTALDKLIEKKEKQDVNPTMQSEQFTILMQAMKKHQYRHYEISNFALPGFESRHNSSYWGGENYLGVGPSAHSYNGHSRQWNIANNALYIKLVRNGGLYFEAETLTPIQKLNEKIMTGLRTSKGFDVSFGRQVMNSAQMHVFEKTVEKYLKRGLLFLEDDQLILTDEGKHFADGIAADFFVE